MKKRTYQILCPDIRNPAAQNDIAHWHLHQLKYGLSSCASFKALTEGAGDIKKLLLCWNQSSFPTLQYLKPSADQEVFRVKKELSRIESTYKICQQKIKYYQKVKYRAKMSTIVSKSRLPLKKIEFIISRQIMDRSRTLTTNILTCQEC